MNFRVPQQVSSLLTERLLAYPEGISILEFTWFRDGKAETDIIKFILIFVL
jgi:hypothetical protein